MLTITIPATEEFDEIKGEFIYVKEQTLQLEHSLISISKWESKWCKPFLGKQDKTPEEVIDYIKCMTLNPNVNDNVYGCLTQANLDAINSYIAAPMTATSFMEDKTGKHNREVVTAELIYYWMIALNIPFECQKWHLNRLLTLVRVCNIKNSPPKKMGKRATANQYAQLNAARRKQMNSRG
jgi:hypothetical protein